MFYEWEPLTMCLLCTGLIVFSLLGNHTLIPLDENLIRKNYFRTVLLVLMIQKASQCAHSCEICLHSS